MTRETASSRRWRRTQHAVVVLTLLAPAAGLPAPAPELRVPVCSTPPVIDASLDDPCWSKAATVERWHIIRPDGIAGETGEHRAWVTMDKGWLYVAFKVAHPRPGFISPRAKVRDGRVQIEDCVKVLFDPGTGFKPWYHFRLSAGNVQSDQRNIPPSSYDKEGFNIPWRSAARVTDSGWQAELALPFCLMMDMGEPDPSKARLNLLIHSLIPVLDRQGVKVDERRELFSWAPVAHRFWDAPERFGHFRGLGDLQVEAPFLPLTRDVRIRPYYYRDGRHWYDVTLQLRSMTGRGGRVKVTVRDALGAGAVRTHDWERDLKPNTTVPLVVPVPVEALRQRSVSVRMTNPDTGETWQETVVSDTSALDVMSAYFARSYYTTEPAAIAICKTGLPAEGLAGARLRAVDANGRELALLTRVQPRTRFPVPLDRLATGTHVLTLELRGRGDVLLASCEDELVKRPPKPGREVKVDFENLVILKEGKPFFPYGVVKVNSGPTHEEHFKAIADAGFNSFIAWRNLTAEEIAGYLDQAASYGLNVVIYPDRNAELVPLDDPASYLGPELMARFTTFRSFKFDREPGTLWGRPMKSLRLYPQFAKLGFQQGTRLFMETTEKNLGRYLTYVEKTKDHPNLLGYFLFDEPMIQSIDQAAAGRLVCDAYHQADEYHPVMTNYSSHIPDVPQATSFCDILCVDPYWVPGSEQAKGRHTIDFVSHITHLMRRRAEKDRKVPWLMPMLEYWSGVWKRFQLPREQRCQTYLALIHGAKGIFYYLYWAFTPQMWETLSDLAEEMKTLGPAAVMPDVPQDVAYAPGTYSFDEGRFPNVQARLFQRPEGGYLLLCANTRAYPVDVQIGTSLFVGGVKVRRLFADREWLVRAGVFTDRLEAHATRAYAFAGIDTVGAEPAKVSIRMTSHKELAEPDVPTPRRFTGERKNMIANPSFEEATFPGWPDYFKPIQYTLASCGKHFVLDSEDAFHGKRSLKLISDGRRVPTLYFHQGDSNLNDPYTGDPKVEYVLSAYLRADHDGVRVRMKAKTRYGDVKLSTSWKRYTWKVTLPSRIYFICNPTRKGPAVVWIDALQLENGDRPTEFEP